MQTKEKLRLVYLADVNVGGAQRTMINIVNQWHKQGIRFNLAIGNAKGGALSWLDPEITYIDLKVRRQLLALPKLTALFLRLKPDAVFTSLAHANVIVLLAALLSLSRMKVTIRETNNPDKVFAHKWLLKFLARHLYPRADHVIALSEQVKDELAATFNLDPHKLITLPNPVALSGGEHEDQTHPLPKGRFIITVGRLNIQKNLPLLIRAYADAKDLPALYIIGDGNQKQRLLNEVKVRKLENRIHFLNHENNVLSWMAAAEFFILPSSWEGFGHVIVEAMSQGCPVIATSCSGPIEIITHGEDGILVPIDDKITLTKEMEKLAQSSEMRQTLGHYAKARSKDFDAITVSLRYRDAIDGKT